MKQQTQPSTPGHPEAVLGVPRSTTTTRKKKQEEVNINEYLHMLKRRWKLIATVASILFVLISIVILMLPATYRADVLVLLQSPSIAATNSVVVQPDVQQKLAALREQVDSRRTLGKVIKKFDLYSASKGAIPEDEIYDMMRKSITLKLGKSSFNLFFDHPDPQTAADVANELSRHYIEENTRIRRESLENTSAFISTQLRRLERDVKEMESVLQEFRKQNMGAMPEDVPANQALLMALSSQVAQTESNLDSERLRKRKAEDRIAELISTEIAQRHKAIKTLTNSLKRLPAVGENLSNDADVARAEPKAEAPIEVAVGAGGDAEAERKRLVDRQQELEIAVNRLKNAAGAAGPNVPPPPELARLKEELDKVNAELEKRPEKPQLPPALAAELEKGIDTAVGDDVEMEMLREQIRQRETTVGDAQRNVEDLEGLLKRGMVSEIVVKKARNDLERAKGDLRIQRTQVMRQRINFQEQLKSNETELASLKEFQTHWSELMVKIQEIEAQRLRITSQATEDQVKSAAQRIEAMTGELAAMRQKHSEYNLKLFSGRGELAQQVQEHENIMAALVRQQNDIQAAKIRVADLDRRLTNSARVQVQLPELMRKYKTITDQYEAMLRHKMQADMAMGVEDQQEGERMVIWDPAIRQTSPFKPKYSILFAAALFLSVGAGVVLALLMEMMAPKFLTADILHNRTGLEVLAEFDELPNRDVPRPLPQGMPESSAKVVTLSDPWHRLSKQFLDCACVLFKPQAAWPRVVAVCSPGHGDGKTFVSANLAAALAISSRSPTILIDANLRSPMLHTMFDKPRDSGLAEALEGGPIHVHPLPGSLPCDLQLMTAGTALRHGAVLLGSMRFKEMMEKISYQGTRPRIILDTPPLKGGADVDVLLDAVDGVLLVIRRGHTAMAEVERALRRIPREKLIGVIFNGRM